MTTALLIIDVQQGLCEGEHNAFESADVIGRINRVSAKARTAGVPVVFIQHESESGYLEFGTGPWQLAKALHTEPSDLRIRKTTPDSFLRTELEAVLQARAVTDLIICGMHTEFCVDTTTRRALALGYPVTLIEDAHTTEGNAYVTPRQIIQHHNATLTNISSFGPRVRAVSSEALQIEALQVPCGCETPVAPASMGLRLDHMIVPSRDRRAAADLLSRILGVPWSETGVGPFCPVYINDGLTLDMDQAEHEFPVLHYCFRVSDAEFDALVARLEALSIEYRSTPHGPVDMQVNTHHGGRIVYWSQPDGHVWEALTVSYARQSIRT